MLTKHCCLRCIFSKAQISPKRVWMGKPEAYNAGILTVFPDYKATIGVLSI